MKKDTTPASFLLTLVLIGAISYLIYLGLWALTNVVMH